MPRHCVLCPLIESLEAHTLLSTYYVSPSGSDSNNGSAASPWATLQQAANTVQAGDTVDVQAGSYAGFVLGGTRPQNGTPGAPITFKAEPAPSSTRAMPRPPTPSTWRAPATS